MPTPLHRLILFLLLLAPLTACEQPRVLVLEADGFAWEVIDPLMDGGYLPTIKKIVDGGVRADLYCADATSPGLPCFCPQVWATAMSGVKAWRHGINNFAQNSDQRSSAMLWDVLRAEGVTTNLFSLHNTWPGEPNAEIVLTEEGAHLLGDLFYEITPNGEFARQAVSPPLYRGAHGRRLIAALPGTWTQPAGLYEQLGLLPYDGPRVDAWFPVAKDRVAMELLARVAKERQRDTQLSLKDALPEEARKYGFLNPHKLLRAYNNMSYGERRQFRDGLLGIADQAYLDVILLHSNDRQSHMTWKSIQERPFDSIDVEALYQSADAWTGPFVTPPPFQWGRIGWQYLEFDQWLGDLLSQGYYDHVVILSDHGFQPNPIPSGSPPGVHNDGQAYNGVFIMKGPKVKRGLDIGRISVLEVAPSLAYVFDAPIATNLHGGLVERIFSEDVLEAQPPRYIESWQPYLPTQW